jgi:hypothetical protein
MFDNAEAFNSLKRRQNLYLLNKLNTRNAGNEH